MNHHSDANANHPVTTGTVGTLPLTNGNIPLDNRVFCSISTALPPASSHNSIPHSLSSEGEYVTLNANSCHASFNTRLTPRCTSTSSSEGMNERIVGQNWDRLVSMAELSASNVVNGEESDMLSFIDDGYTVSSSDPDTCSQTSMSQLSTVASSGYHSMGDTSRSSGRGCPQSTSNHGPPYSFSNPTFTMSSTQSRSKTTSPSTNYPQNNVVSTLRASSQNKMSRSCSHDLVSAPSRSLCDITSSSSESLLSIDSTSHNTKHVSSLVVPAYKRKIKQVSQGSLLPMLTLCI